LGARREGGYDGPYASEGRENRERGLSARDKFGRRSRTTRTEERSNEKQGEEEKGKDRGRRRLRSTPKTTTARREAEDARGRGGEELGVMKTDEGERDRGRKRMG